MMRERIASSVAMPPALRITWASPVLKPRIWSGMSRASMQASTANFRAGGIGRSPSWKLLAWASFALIVSSVILIFGISLDLTLSGRTAGLTLVVLAELFDTAMRAGLLRLRVPWGLRREMWP